jgi:hypothetical protein
MNQTQNQTFLLKFRDGELLCNIDIHENKFPMNCRTYADYYSFASETENMLEWNHRDYNVEYAEFMYSKSKSDKDIYIRIINDKDKMFIEYLDFIGYKIPKLYVFYKGGIGFIDYKIIIANNEDEMYDKLISNDDFLYPCVYCSDGVNAEYIFQYIDTNNLFKDIECNENYFEDDLTDIGYGLENPRDSNYYKIDLYKIKEKIFECIKNTHFETAIGYYGCYELTDINIMKEKFYSVDINMIKGLTDTNTIYEDYTKYTYKFF